MVRRTWCGRFIARVLSVTMVASAVWAVAATVVVEPVAAADEPSTYRYDPEYPAGSFGYQPSDHAMSMSTDARSVGFVNDPVLPTFARAATGSGAEGTFVYAVADVRADGTGRDLWSLEAPGMAGEHPFESQLSGDGLTFVATYVNSGRMSGGTCWNDGDPGTPDSLYWHSQVLRWERDDRDSGFGDPELVSLADPGDCNGVSSGPDRPPLVGVGGDAESRHPTVSDDGEVVAFASRAQNLPGAPITSTAGLYVAEEEGGTWAPSLVTATNLDGDVRDPMISGDGDHIVFVSDATNVVAGVTPPTGGDLAYLATRDTSTTPASWDIEVVSQNDDGHPARRGIAGASVGEPTIDADGERIAFVTDATNLDASVLMPAQGPVVVVRDVLEETTRMAVSHRQDSLQGQHLGYVAGRAHISRDGKRVAVFARRNLGRSDSQLVLLNADAVLDVGDEDRREARLYSKVYARFANAGLHAAIEGGSASPEGGYTAVFPSGTIPNRALDGYGPAMFVVGGGVLGHDEARGWHGDPVDTANGAFRQDEVDLTAPSGAGRATIGRTHSSVGELAGVFGAGWSSSLDEHLVIDAQNLVVTLVELTGLRRTFLGDGSGWRTDDGSRLVLFDDGGTWRVVGPDGGTRSFDGNGRATGWSEPDAPVVTVQWTAGVPTTISTDAGYEVALVDDAPADGLIDHAVSSDGRQVDYGYTVDARGVTRLETVSRPHAVGQAAGTFGVRTYTWDGPRVARIVDQVDATRTKVVVENTYDMAGRVLHQVTDTGDELDFAYGRRPDPFGVLVAAPGFTTVTNAASGDVTVYEYNDGGEVVGVTDAAGHSLTRSWASDRPDAATSRSGVTTDQVYDDAGRLVTVTQTAGATTRTIETLTYLTPDTSPDALTDDRIATRTDEAGVTTTYEYVGESRQPWTVSVPCDPASAGPSTPCPASGLATTTYTYFPWPLVGLVETVTDADGVVTAYTYDPDDRSLATMTTFDGATPTVTTYATTRAGDPGWVAPTPAAVEVRTTTTPGGAVTTEIYDAEGRLIETRDPLYDGTTHLATTYTYGLDGELLTTTDPGAGTTTTSVARPGDPGWAEPAGTAEIRTVTGPDGISTISKVDRSGDVVVEQRGDPAVPAELATTTHVYGELGRLESTTDPMGVTTTFEYDAEGRLTDVIDEDGKRTVTDHDAFGRVEVVTDPLGQTTTTTYDDGQVASVEDREGHDTLYAYDDAGRLHTTTDARGGVVERSYTPAGRLATETDATGRTTEYRYDTAGRQTGAELPSGATTITGFDEDGRVETVTSPEGRVTSYTYDDLGRVETVADPATGTTTTTYWPTGEVKTLTDATGAEVEYAYEGGLLTSVTDPLERETTYDYDSRGNRTLRTDARGGEREWHWNLADQLTSEVDPLNRATTHTYDHLGRLDITTDGAGRANNRGYDAGGQVVSSQMAGQTTTYTYDDEGRRETMTSGAGTTTWTYDEAGNVRAIDEIGIRDVAWTYDLAGRRTEITLPNGGRQRQVYDPDGRLDGIERWDGTAWVGSVDLDLDDDGLAVARDVAGGLGATWDRDPATGRVASYSEDLGGTVTTTGLTYDAAGRVETEITAAGTTTYDYDDAGQLKVADRPGTAADESFSYDELGRRTTSGQGATSTTYSWDAASQLTSRTVGSTAHTYTYDASGRRTRETWDSGTRYRQWAYSSRGELSLIRHVTPTGTDETTRYLRGDGRLLSSTTTPAGGSARTTLYAWDDTQAVEQPVWMRIGASNNVTATYAAGLARLQCSSSTVDCEGPIAHDALGSAVETPDTDDVVAADTYTTFGHPGTTVGDPEHGYRDELHIADLI